MMATPSFHLAVSPGHLVFSEIIAVTSAMRKNSRWASTQPGPTRASGFASSMGLRAPAPSRGSLSKGGQDRQETVLMAGFDQLKRDIRDAENVLALPLPSILSPFLALIRSPLSTGPITSTALSSIHSFFLSGLINNESPDIKRSLEHLSNALAHCKFEASDSSGDEVVLLRILSIISECISSSVGDELGDAEVCEMLETVLTICCQMRLSETLRRSAETTMHAIARRVFNRLKDLDPTSATEDFSDTAEPGPYGLPSVQELLRVLINLLDPHDKQHTDSIRITSLGILNAALELAGKRVGDFPSLSTMLLDQGCKYLFQLARSDNTTILNLSLRVISTLFDTLRPHFKLQAELFLSFTMDRLAPPAASLPPRIQLSLKAHENQRRTSSTPGTPTVGSKSSAAGDPSQDPMFLDSESMGDHTPPPNRPSTTPAQGLTRELLLETLGHIARKSSFMVDLWVNYDCDINCEDLFERLITFLTRGVYPAQYIGGLESQRYTAQLLCLDLLLAYVDHMAARSELGDDTWPEENPQPTQLSENKAKKRILISGAAKFNSKPKTGLAFLEENGLIAGDGEGKEGLPRAQSLAKFLKSTPRLDKKLLGEYISRHDNPELLKAFMQLFNFKGKSIADAMRELLESFRLPGEAQPIARITETFAEVYFNSEPAEVKTQDAVYVLAYSVIMLNTDLYNPQNRKRMTVDDYKKNLRGVNDGADFTPEYLGAIYESIRKREIVMPEEHTGQLGFDYAWKELLQRNQAAEPLLQCDTPLFDMSMFQLTWKPVISAIAFAFTAFDDDYVVERAIAGFRQCATLAGHFNLPEVFDYIVRSLSHATGLLAEEDSAPAKFPIVQHESQAVTVSPLSIKFGTNIRAQLATVVLFTIANGNGNAIRQGWALIFEMFETLFLHSLLPASMLQMEDFLGGVSMIPLQGNIQSNTALPRSDGGLLSALSSYLMTPYGAGSDALLPEPTEGDIENTLSTMDCIGACKLDELYCQIMTLELDALTAALRSLQVLADRRTVDLLSQDANVEGPLQPSQRFDDQIPLQMTYDPASVFLLEVMVSIARKAPEHIDELWPIVFEHISGLLRASERFSVLLIERAVVGLLRLCLIISDMPALRDQVYVAIDLLGGLPPVVMNSVAEQLVAGLALIVEGKKCVIKSPTEWGLVCALLRKTLSHPEAAKSAFKVIEQIITADDGKAVSADNMSGLITILDDFGVAANLAVEGMRMQQRRPAAPVNVEPVVERGLAAVELLSELKRFVPSMIERAPPPKQAAWSTSWTPVLLSLSKQSTNASREIRNAALGHLQRILLGPQITAGLSREEFDFQMVYDSAVFPFLDELFEQRVYNRDPQGMPETRLRAATLLCKTFLHFCTATTTTTESKLDDIRDVWLNILEYLEQFMKMGRRDPVYEAVPESLKNVILVMHASDLLAPSPSGAVDDDGDTRTASQKSLWKATYERMEAFLPGFLDELVPSPPPPPAAAPNAPDPTAPQGAAAAST